LGISVYSGILIGGIKTGKAFFPDLSAQHAFGKKRIFRFGCGAKVASIL
jgi:hypothetical protein